MKVVRNAVSKADLRIVSGAVKPKSRTQGDIDALLKIKMAVAGIADASLRASLEESLNPIGTQWLILAMQAL